MIAAGRLQGVTVASMHCSEKVRLAKCIPCPVGYYCNNDGMIHARPCPIGKYMDSTGAHKC